MSRFAVLWLFCAVVCGALLFQTSQAVTDSRAQIDRLTAETRREEDSLRVLQAEWSYLNQPDRLEKLSAQYLKLTPMRGRQFAALQDLPLRPAPPAEETPPPEAAALLSEAAAAAALIDTASGAYADAPAALVETAGAGMPLLPLRKPAARGHAAYAPPVAAPVLQGARALTPERTKSMPAAPQPAPAPLKPYAGDPAAQRSFSDVLESLGGGGRR